MIKKLAIVLLIIFQTTTLNSGLFRKPSLYKTIKKGSTESLKKLIDKYIKTYLNINTPINPQDSRTFLHLICMHPRIETLEIVHYLLASNDAERKANPNLRDNYGRTPLHYAVIFECTPAVIKELLSAGATFSDDDFGKTPYDYAMAILTEKIQRQKSSCSEDPALIIVQDLKPYQPLYKQDSFKFNSHLLT